MLLELNIKNFAIIDSQNVSFGAGLNVISGETGSGKSMVLQALELILGARPKSNYIRSGTDGWELQALFDLRAVPDKLRAELPDIAQADELVVSRSMNEAGRGKVYINGQLGSVALLEEIAQRIINICGQGHHMRLLDPRYHLEMIDGFCGSDKLLDRYREAFERWKAADLSLREIEQKLKEGVQKRAELEAVIAELAELKIVPGIRLELEAQVKRMSNAEGLIESGREITGCLSGESGVLSQCQSLSRELGTILKLDPETKDLGELFSTAETHLQEFERGLNGYLSAIEINEDELEELRRELSELARLERKYKTNDVGLIELLDKSLLELGRLDNEQSLASLRAEVQTLFAALSDLADQLSALRKKSGAKLAQLVQKQLAELNMGDAALTVEQSEVELNLSGKDRLQFLISTNKGEPVRPLKEVASGGELSRIMLILKTVLKERTGVNVLVFDEVDAGVSGGVARAVGEKLLSLSEQSQVLCITHLPQVASLANHHLLVEKKVGKRTVAQIREISGEEKVQEIARMLAGYKITSASRESALELLTSKL